MKVNEKYKGILYIILAAFGFAVMNLFVKRVNIFSFAAFLGR